jgi:adenosylmethionine-8-amino-7-oxononanoate aminotransferase
MAEMPNVGDIRQCGFMVGIELVTDKRAKEPFPLSAKVGHRVASIARTKGLILRPIGNVLVLLPPLSTSAEELKKMLEILKESVETRFDTSNPRGETSNHMTSHADL